MTNRNPFLLAGVCVASLISQAAFAQANEAAEQPEADAIVVTGTLVRGVAPVGSQVTTIGTDSLQRQGVTQLNQVLAAIPQMSGFNGVPRTATASQGVSGYRPNLRNLPPLQNGTTLILLDSHNLVGGSVQQNFPDISALPAAALERVEVVLDGGSATYGSDAVGGVLNFITRSRFDGVQISGNAGIVPGSNYRAWAIDAVAGEDWDGGSAVLALSHRENNPLYASERRFPRQDLRPFGGSDFRGRTCAPGNIVVGSQTYALPGRQPGTLNLCDAAALGTIASRERQTSGYLSVSQDLADALELQIKGFYTDRRTETPTAALVDSGAVINATNPFFRPIGTETQHTVAFSWEPVTGRRSTSTLTLKQFDITPSLTWRLGGDWQLKALADYGQSELGQFAPQINTTAEVAALRGAGLTPATALNPYDLTATSPAVLAAITDYGVFNHTKQTLATGRVIVDGPVFALPGGQVRLAVGGQVQRVTKDDYAIVGPARTTLRTVETSRSRDISALFGELVIPIVGSDNAMPLVRKLTLDVSGRYNHYEAIGSTFDPKIGLDWTLADGLSLRGNWGTSFVAPGINDTTTGGIDSVIIIASSSGTLRANDPLRDRNRPSVTIQGGGPGLKPVKAETWSVGLDYRPAFLPALTLAATYWSVSMKDLIQPGCPNTLAQQLADTQFEGVCYYYKPSLEQALALTRNIKIYSGAGNSLEALYGADNDPYILSDGRKKNYGGYNTAGLDFRASYRQPTSWGAFYGSVSGTRYLKRESQTFPTAPFIDALDADFSRLAAQAIAGAEVGRFAASVTVNYQSGYRLTGVSGQTRLGAYAPVNLFLRYSLGEDADITLNVDNVADDYPPFINRSNGILGSTLGRYVALGFRTKL